MQALTMTGKLRALLRDLIAWMASVDCRRASEPRAELRA